MRQAEKVTITAQPRSKASTYTGTSGKSGAGTCWKDSEVAANIHTTLGINFDERGTFWPWIARHGKHYQGSRRHMHLRLVPKQQMGPVRCG
eukprot:6210089-Pleurochrysis_carterae.AAC.1